MNPLDEWISDAAAALSLPPASIPVDLRDALLDLTRDVAHNVARVAGPLTCYLAGMAVANGTAPSTVTATLRDLVASRARADPPGSPDPA